MKKIMALIFMGCALTTGALFGMDVAAKEGDQEQENQFLLYGPPGVGKSELAKKLAAFSTLGDFRVDDPERLERTDMLVSTEKHDVEPFVGVSTGRDWLDMGHQCIDLMGALQKKGVRIVGVPGKERIVIDEAEKFVSQDSSEQQETLDSLKELMRLKAELKKMNVTIGGDPGKEFILIREEFILKDDCFIKFSPELEAYLKTIQ